MIKKFLLIIILLLYTSILYSTNSYKFRLILDLQSHPIFYEFQYKAISTSFNSSLMLGLRINNFTIGNEVFVDYYSFDGKDEANIFRGAWFSLRSTINLYYRFNQWLELKGGIGGIWLRLNFEYEDAGWLNTDQYGISLLLNLKIFTWKYIDLEIINKVDLMFLFNLDSQLTGINPYYIGGLRINFHPYVTWLSLYIEVDGMYFNYAAFNRDIKTGTILASAGVSIDLTFPREKIDEKYEKENKKIIKKKEKKEIQKKNDTTEEDNIVKEKEQFKDEEDKIKEEKLADPNLKKLYNAEVGDIIVFNGVIFEYGNNNIIPESIQLLDYICSILLEKNDFVIKISSYSEYFGNPMKEFDLCKLRVKKIKEYFIIKGINEKRIEIDSNGQILRKDMDIKQFAVLNISITAKKVF